MCLRAVEQAHGWIGRLRTQARRGRSLRSSRGERVEAWMEQAALAEAGALEEVEGWRAAAQVEEIQGQVAGLEGERA